MGSNWPPLPASSLFSSEDKNVRLNSSKPISLFSSFNFIMVLKWSDQPTIHVDKEKMRSVNTCRGSNWPPLHGIGSMIIDKRYVVKNFEKKTFHSTPKLKSWVRWTHHLSYLLLERFYLETRVILDPSNCPSTRYLSILFASSRGIEFQNISQRIMFWIAFKRQRRLFRNIWKIGYNMRGFWVFGKLEPPEVFLSDTPPESSRKRVFRSSIFSTYFW